MSDLLKRVKVFVASPGDVSRERDKVSNVVSEINLIISAMAPDKGIVLELVRWETHVHPGLGKDAQDVVNQQIGDYDIFLGIMWKRFGTPTSTAGSGTAEEFQRAYSKWQQDNNFPVLFYFCQAASSPPRTREEMDQLNKVLEFRTDLSDKGLVWEYEDPENFDDVIRPHLILVLSRMFSQKDSPEGAAQETGRLATESDVSAVRKQIMGLAAEYEQLRKDVPSGMERTRQMTVIESRMRSLALSAFPLLAELTSSLTPGARLAAVALLQEIPSPQYLTWLADRVGSEKPFIGFHATLALLAAARRLGKSRHDEVASAVRRAKVTLGNLKYQDPNQVRILDDAQTELDRPQ